MDKNKHNSINNIINYMSNDSLSDSEFKEVIEFGSMLRRIKPNIDEYDYIELVNLFINADKSNRILAYIMVNDYLNRKTNKPIYDDIKKRKKKDKYV